MMRHVLCILALLLSCACVHVLAEEVPAADLSDQVPDAENDSVVRVIEGPEGKLKAKGDSNCPDGVTTGICALPVVQRGGDALECSPGKTSRTPDGTCTSVSHPAVRQPELSHAAESREGSVHTDVNDPAHNSRHPVGGDPGNRGKRDVKDPDVNVKGPKVDLEQTQKRKEERSAEDTQEGRTPPEGGNQAGRDQNHQAQASDRETTSRSPDTPSSVVLPTTSRTDETTTVGDTSAQQIPSGNRSQDNSDQGDNVKGANTQNTHTTGPESNDGEDSSTSRTQSTGDTSSSNTSTDEAQNNQAESDPNVAKPSEGESTSNEESTTTTTTTTLPPELTNNKKGDADSSSSSMSSVWVRVPLLIVATLACILVC
ncbi:uncharacterized protein TM35_000501470 [Trypanosoma theileri]|uniref:Mucin-associated surface protein (MASP) n=1 Tax=Trypanosoma theileri TaxID=67003 RepID=A0A1X0NHZ9_9TRYP|nr:uncharacterized protein TM35_000501470 [Trypanosoma theileri]ORC84093.1 hypothetical protein TM35_000501470 [Trypanosoma theileri]